NSSIPDVALGWTNVYWRIMEYLIVFFGVTHGFNGLRVVMEDYFHREAVRRALRFVIISALVVVLAVAAYIISNS
ncbi:MAG TPA: hypothetical protein VGK81_13890, partial [Anaerolineae bacterium]